MMSPLLSKYSARKVLLLDYAIRIISGILWFFPVIYNDALGDWAVPFLMASRFTYGLTLNSFAVPMSWVGVRMHKDQRPLWVARLFGLVLLGIVLGSGMAVISPSKTFGYATPGLLAILGSAFLWLLTFIYFDDSEALVKPAMKEEAADKGAITLAWINVLGQFLGGCAFLAGFESTISLQIYEAYGWWKAWAPFALSQLIFSVSISPYIIDRNNGCRVWLYSTVLIALTLLGINWFDLSQPIPVFLFVFENFCSNGIIMHSTFIQGQMTTRLPDAQQVKFQAISALAGQVGRAVGPVLATTVFHVSTQMLPGPGTGMNFSRLYMIVVGWPGILVPMLCFFKTVYGTWSDEAPAVAREKRLGAAKIIQRRQKRKSTDSASFKKKAALEAEKTTAEASKAMM